ncbi:dTDP-glucose 4,6-dehydratase [Methanosarcinales archaeon]|nr:MAG: dTDP-glucose 4,6-dehydratase [Methanosarcinales archaeon]
MWCKYSVIIILIVSMIIGGCVDQGSNESQEPQEPIQPKKPVLKTEPIDLSSTTAEKMDFANHYSLNPLEISLNAPQYDLPLQTNQISNYEPFSREIQLSDDALSLLEKNGFVVIDNPFDRTEEDIVQPYKMLADDEIPIFVTTDSLLHLYHIQFDETLRQIEEREFYDLVWEISEQLLNSSMESYKNSDGDLKEAARRDVAYFSVGLSLLKPKPDQVCQSENEWDCTDAYFKKEDLTRYSFEVQSYVRDDVEAELKLIEAHSGFAGSPIFIYKEDYSQYVPRGHYTRSEKLKNYFRAFMWYGRTSMLLKGSDAIPPGTADPYDPVGLISQYDARIQTTGACLIASEFAADGELMGKWDRIYSVTAFYVGLSDDLGPYEYIDALNSVFGGSFDPDNLNDETIGELKVKLTEYGSPKIYGGTGNCVAFTSEEANQCLNNTAGFRLMGQRFIPDSYMFTNLVGVYTGLYEGDGKKPFTFIIDGAGRPVRGFPRGLDVMALLGSDRSKELLDELNDSNYKYYDRQYKELEAEFDSFDTAEWNKNLYWSWLFALKPLLYDHGAGYPTFMQTDAWQDKELTTAMASWAELRHDTILYAKQSYTMVAMCAPPMGEEKPAVGYVEPVPEFYNRLLALTRMTNSGLAEMDVLDSSSKRRLENLESILTRLVNISSKELENEELSKDDYDFIKNFGDNLDGVIADVEDKAKKTTIVADVHTDGNTEQVLEEGVGYVDLIVVAYKLPDGRILVGAGPVMSYYEFKQPMDDRLTDEAWRELLDSNPPDRPEWASNVLRSR